MYENTVDSDYVRTELAYRLNRVQDDIAGRRRRRSLRSRRRRVEADGLTWTSLR